MLSDLQSALIVTNDPPSSNALTWYNAPATPENLVFMPDQGQPPEGHPYGDDGVVFTPQPDSVSPPLQDGGFKAGHWIWPAVAQPPQEGQAQEGQPPEGHPYGDDGVVYSPPADVVFIGAAQTEDCFIVYA